MYFCPFLAKAIIELLGGFRDGGRCKKRKVLKTKRAAMIESVSKSEEIISYGDKTVNPNDSRMSHPIAEALNLRSCLLLFTLCEFVICFDR